MKKRFNPEEYAKLKHRVEVLKSRIQLDNGPEQATAQRLLNKVQNKLTEYEITHEIPETEQVEKDCNSTTTGFDFWNSFWDEPVQEPEARSNASNSEGGWNPNPNFKWHIHFEEDLNYHEDSRFEEEMVRDLGVLYAIFGSTYKTYLNYHEYKIRFKKQTDKDYAFYRVYSDIYEDNIRIVKDVIIGFWPYNLGDDVCGDMEFAFMNSNNRAKYNNGCSIIYTKLLDGLKEIWNLYFDSELLLAGPVVNYIEDKNKNSSKNEAEIQLNEKQREEVITRVEEAIDSGKMRYLEFNACNIQVQAYKPYNSLSEFLNESGVVYLVEKNGIYIWNAWQERYGMLVGYEYYRPIHTYTLYLK